MIAPLLPHPEHQQLFMFLQMQLAHLCQHACMPKLVSRGGFLTLDTTTSEAWQSLGYSGFNSLQFNSLQFTSIQCMSIQFTSFTDMGSWIQFTGQHVKPIHFNSIQFNACQLFFFQFMSNQFISNQFTSIQSKLLLLLVCCFVLVSSIQFNAYHFFNHPMIHLSSDDNDTLVVRDWPVAVRDWPTSHEPSHIRRWDAASRQKDRKQLSCQRLACASPFLWLLGLKQASRIKLSETGCAIVQCQPNIMNIIVAHINSREIWLAFLCVWVGADDPRCNCVAGSPRNDHNTDLQFAGHCHKD